MHGIQQCFYYWLWLKCAFCRFAKPVDKMFRQYILITGPAILILKISQVQDVFDLLSLTFLSVIYVA